MPIKLFRTLALLACLPLCCATRAESWANVSADALRADVAFIRATIARVHPDPGFSVDPDELAHALDAITANTPAEMTQDAAWRRLSLLNPVLADGHLFLGYADWRAEGAAHLAASGGFFRSKSTSTKMVRSSSALPCAAMPVSWPAHESWPSTGSRPSR